MTSNTPKHQDTTTSAAFHAWLETAPEDQLIAFHNKHADRPVRMFSDRTMAVSRCRALWERLQVSFAGKVINTKERPAASDSKRPAMSESMRLPDRRIRYIETGQVWANAMRLRRENPEWMTSAQQDRLTRKLYSAAKAGQHATVEINGRTFELVNSFVSYDAQSN